MQPNQQDNNNWQNQPPADGGYVSPTGANVPEYLHMEPVADLNARRPKKRKLITVAIAIISTVILGAAVFGIVIWLQGASERRFYQALDSLMQTAYVARNISTTTSVGDDFFQQSRSATIDAQSDFSNPAKPMSSYSYKYSYESNDTTRQESTKEKAAADVVVLDESRYMTRFKEYSRLTTKNIQIGTWYEISASNDDYTKQLFDPGSLRNSINSSIGVVFMGTFDDNKRRSMIDSIQKNKVYTINQTHTEKIQDHSYSVYTVTVNVAKFLEASKILYGFSVGDQPTGIDTSSNEIEIWIDEKTNLIVKTITKTRMQNLNNLSTNTTTQYRYSEKISITIPSDTIKPSDTSE